MSAYCVTSFIAVLTTVFSDRLITNTYDIIVSFDTIVEFAILLYALLTLSPVMWRKEHLSNFTVLQKVHNSSRV
jgi:hypothetical protein